MAPTSNGDYSFVTLEAVTYAAKFKLIDRPIHMNQAQQLQAEAKRIAQEQFGYVRLQPGQQEALEQILQGRDTLVVMPTGAGKSAIYQIAGTLLPGATVVVSPFDCAMKAIKSRFYLMK